MPEPWRDRPELGIRVHRSGQIHSLKTGRVLSATHFRGHDYVTIKVDGRRRTRRVHVIIAETFSPRLPASSRPEWTAQEESTLRRARTFAEAYAALPFRSVCAIRNKARKLRLHLIKSAPSRSAPVTGGRPWRDALYVETAAACPSGLPYHLREDLISDVVLMRLEGFQGSMADAFRLARKAHNRMTGAYRERSAFDVIRATDLRLIDTFESGSSL